MPTNPEKEKQRARMFVDEFLRSKKKGGISKKGLIRETILKYAVGPESINKFINDFYVDEGVVFEEDGILYTVDEEVKK